MASVWVYDRKERDKIRGHMAPKSAVKLMEKMLAQWHSKGGTHKRVDAFDALLYDAKGKLRCGLFVEVMSPPTAPEPGQPKRKATA